MLKLNRLPTLCSDSEAVVLMLKFCAGLFFTAQNGSGINEEFYKELDRIHNGISISTILTIHIPISIYIHWSFVA